LPPPRAPGKARNPLRAVVARRSASWHGIKINAAAIAQLEALRKTTFRQKEEPLKAI
jgi:hypothetical protein